MNYEEKVNKIEKWKNRLHEIVNDKEVVGGKRVKKLKGLAEEIGATILSHLSSRLGEEAWEAELVHNIHQTLLLESYIALSGETQDIAKSSNKQAKETRRLCWSFV